MKQKKKENNRRKNVHLHSCVKDTTAGTPLKQPVISRLKERSSENLPFAYFGVAPPPPLSAGGVKREMMMASTTQKADK